MAKISRFQKKTRKWLIFTLRFDRKVVTLRHHISIIMVYNSIIGRNEEIRKLEKFLKSPKSEFVAIYGRRRVGKSYLVEEVYRDKIVFRAIGSYIKDKDEKTYRQIQLEHFYESLLDVGVPEDTPRPANWREARGMSCLLYVGPLPVGCLITSSGTTAVCMAELRKP